MQIMKPGYYDSFRCLASRCPDTCCQEWDIDVDPESAAKYRALTGPLGDRVRAALREENGNTVIALGAKNHCPLQEPSGLCALQCALGEEGLCQVCREFPRLHHDYGNFLELSLEMSCPEAARILLTAPQAPDEITQVPGGTEPDYDQEAMALLLPSRSTALSFLDREDLREALTLVFFYSCHVQALLDGEDPGEFSPEASLETGRELAEAGDFREFPGFFLELEILTEDWKDLLHRCGEPSLTPLCRNMARYLIRRYWLQAVSDYDLYSRVKFMLISLLLVSALPGDFIANAQLFSKEIENDCDNVDAILDAAFESPVFTDARILGYLLRK